MLESIAKKNGNLNKLLSAIPSKQISVFGCGENERLAIIDSLDSFILYIVDSVDTALKVDSALNTLGKNSRIYNPDFNYASSTIFSYTKINTVLNELLHGDIDALVVPISAFVHKIPCPDRFSKLTLAVGEIYDRNATLPIVVNTDSFAIDIIK